MNSSAEPRYASLSYADAVRRYADTVTRVCIMRLQNYADAEDCFQNTFVKLIRIQCQLDSDQIHNSRLYPGRSRSFLS